VAGRTEHRHQAARRSPRCAGCCSSASRAGCFRRAAWPWRRSQRWAPARCWSSF
jgi:hypothetical protein